MPLTARETQLRDIARRLIESDHCLLSNHPVRPVAMVTVSRAYFAPCQSATRKWSTSWNRAARDIISTSCVMPHGLLNSLARP